MSKNWVFTLNNYTDKDLEELASWPVRYLKFGKEVGELGTPHLQGYVVMHQVCRLTRLKKMCARAHWEQMKGRLEHNDAYVEKEGDWTEIGDKPITQKRKGELNAERWELALQAIKENRIEEVPADIVIQYGRSFQAIRSLFREFDLSDTADKMEWYYGASRTGKSRKAREENPNAYIKMCNKWWDGYNGEEVVLLEDFDKDHKGLCHHLKIWGDRYKFPAEFKGGKMDIRPRKLIVTSNYHPSEIWDTPQELEPILERFRITEFVKEYCQYSDTFCSVNKQCNH